jgi:hypothetical protein
MKYILIGIGLSCVALFSHAELPERYATEEARQEEHTRLNDLKQKMEASYAQEMKQCYQEFDVNSCRTKARERRIVMNAKIRKEELPLKAVERQLKADEARERLAERQSDAQRKKEETARAAAIADAKARADAHEQKQLDHELQGTKRGAYEQKQLDAAKHRADVEKKLRERGKDAAAPLPVPSR